MQVSAVKLLRMFDSTGTTAFRLKNDYFSLRTLEERERQQSTVSQCKVCLEGSKVTSWTYTRNNMASQGPYS